jgi:DNA-3-methyladenine glycosylase II
LSLHSFEGVLKPLAPFNFTESLSFLSDFSPMKNEQEVQNASFTKAVEINRVAVAFNVTDMGGIENPKLHFTAYSKSKLSEEVEKLVADRITFFLSLQDNLKEFYEIAKKDKCLKPVITRFYGHKQVKFLTPFEIACWAVLAQRIPMVIAHRMKEYIIGKLSGQIEVRGIVYRTFPEASKLEVTETAELLELIGNKRKAEYVSAVSKAFSQVEEQWLRTAPYDDVYEWLTDIKGIGDWSAHFVMIRGLQNGETYKHRTSTCVRCGKDLQRRRQAHIGG